MLSHGRAAKAARSRLLRKRKESKVLAPGWAHTCKDRRGCHSGDGAAAWSVCSRLDITAIQSNEGRFYPTPPTVRWLGPKGHKNAITENSPFHATFNTEFLGCCHLSGTQHRATRGSCVEEDRSRFHGSEHRLSQSVDGVRAAARAARMRSGWMSGSR